MGFNNKDLLRFLEEYSFTDKELRTELESYAYIVDNDNLTELGINEGFFFDDVLELWFQKNNSEYTNDDEEIVAYLRRTTNAIN